MQNKGYFFIITIICGLDCGNFLDRKFLNVQKDFTFTRQKLMF